MECKTVTPALRKILVLEAEYRKKQKMKWLQRHRSRVLRYELRDHVRANYFNRTLSAMCNVNKLRKNGGTETEVLC